MQVALNTAALMLKRVKSF